MKSSSKNSIIPIFLLILIIFIVWWSLPSKQTKKEQLKEKFKNSNYQPSNYEIDSILKE